MKKIFTVLLVSLALFLSNNVKSQNDVGVISIDSLSNACSHSATENITIQIKNFGMLTIPAGDTIPLTFQLNSNTVENDTVILSSDFNVGDTITFTYSFTEDLSAAGTYNLYAATNLTGDVSATNNIDTLVVETYGYPTVTLADTVDICSGSSAQLVVSGGDYYLWNTTDTVDTISVTPSAATTYYVTVTDTNQCSSYDSVYVDLHTVSVSFSGGTQVCEGDTLTITANGGTSYLWNTSDTTASINISPADTTTYSVIVTDEYSCSATDSITINTIATNFVFPNDTFVCAGDSVQLTAAGGDTYSWSNGATTNSTWVTPTDTTVYSVTISNSTCSNTNNITVYYNNIPTVTTSFSDTTICANYALTCIASGADTYSWSNGDTTATANLTSSSTTTYTVTGTQNGCSATASVTVTTNASPDVYLEDEYNLHTNNVIALGVSAGYTYIWNTGETTNTIFVDGSSLGVGTYDYWVKATDATNGCITIDSTIINVSWGLGFNDNNIAKINIYPNPTTNYVIISTNFDYFNYQITDVNGRIISSNIINSNVAKIDFTQYQKGIYFIKINNNNKVFINKIINK